MKLDKIKNVVTGSAARQLLTVQKHSPAILFGVGVAGVVGTVVLATRASLKADKMVLNDHRADMKHIRAIEHVDYSEEDRTKDTILRYSKTAVALTKLYGPALIVGGLSIAALTGSHVILNKRHAGVVAAYKLLEKSYDEYRERVVKDLGTDKDNEYRYGMVDVTVEEEIDGKKVKTKTKAIDPNAAMSMYAKLFDDNSTSWSPTPDYNIAFLRAQQSYMNDRLKARGHVFLNEVYDALGLERTSAGQVVGWVKGNGDDYIDFGVFADEMSPEKLAFFTGREKAIWLDFNVDGLVYELI